MTIDQSNVGDVTVLKVAGEITMDGLGGLRISDRVRRVLQEGGSQILLDLSAVPYVDSAGLGDLVASLSAVQNRRGALKLVHLTKRLNDLLVITRLLTAFDCYDDQAKALASFATQTAEHRQLHAGR